MNFLMRETRKELQIMTKPTANPMAMPLMTALVMARVEHIPRSWRETGLSSHSPLLNSSQFVLVAIASLDTEPALLFQFFNFFLGDIDTRQSGSGRYGRPGDGVHFILSERIFLDGRLAQHERLFDIPSFPKLEKGLRAGDLGAQAGRFFLIDDKQAVDPGQLG